MLASRAGAQCAPDPTQANGITTCSGTDPDGIVVTTSGTTVNVAAGAVVNASARAAIGVNVPANNYSSSYDTVNVAGRVTGTAQPGVALYANTYSGAVNLTLTVAAGGSISGSNALLLTQGAGASPYAGGTASVDNSGTLTGTGGIALLANGSNFSFGTITNRASGVMGAIAGAVGTLSNAGLIDGGTNSAINANSTSYVSGYPWTNAGTIRSASTSATIQAGSSGLTTTLANSGTVANSGTGAAITGATLTIQNLAGGRITSAGATAINATTQLNLVNLGTIVGDVVASTPSGYSFTSSVDSSAGTVTGSLRLGAENDTLVARYTGTRTLATGFSGTVDGGGGTNTEQVTFAANTSVTTPIDLATNFQQLGLVPAAGVTATLTSGFQTAATVVLAGTGSVINQGTIATGGQAVVSGFNSNGGSLASFSNQGTISGTSPSGNPLQYAVQLNGVASVSNSGTISASGGGVSFSGGGKLTNTGTITASGTALSVSSSGIDNRGTITSTGGTALSMFGAATTNSGMIRGTSIGVDLGGTLTNTGTISSSGTAVLLEGYGALINAAGGVVTGGNRAVSATTYNSTVVNAGTINGAVTFASPYASYNQFISQTGGVLNGNLTLGSGDLLLTDLANPGRGQFAGINGTVTAAAGALLRYRVASDASATVGPVGPFAIAGYELSNNAKLTLTAGGTTTQPLLLAGTGSVDINAAFAAIGAPAIQSSSVTSVPGTTSTPTTVLAITSRGAISYARSANGSGYGANAAVSLGAQDSFTNLGTITVNEPSSGYSTAAITGGYYSGTGPSVTNAGTIRLNGGYGVLGVGSLNNTGTITQVTGGATASGVSNVGTVTNSGTISVGGTAVQLGQFSSSTLTNSGTLRSMGGAAVVGSSYGYGSTISNLAGGVIAGGAGTAVQVSGGSFFNAGSVTGTVNLGYSPYGAFNTSATYIAAGGTVTGDVLFGAGYNVFLQTGATTGVSGTIKTASGGYGRNLYARSFTADGTFALDAVPVINFQDRLAQAIGAGTTVTTTGTLTGDLYATGVGNLVNQATVTGQLILGSVGYYAGYNTASLLDQNAPASVLNSGTITGGVSGSTASFTNSGTIGSTRLGGSAVAVGNNGPLSFTNSGQITSASGFSFYNAVQLNGIDRVSAANSGTVGGGMSVNATFAATDKPGAVSIANAGTISTTSISGPALFVQAGALLSAAGGNVAITNSGTIANSSVYSAFGVVSYLGGGNTAPVTFSLVNSGALTATAGTGSAYPSIATALQLVGGDARVAGTITNAAGGSIVATGPRAYGVTIAGTSLVLDNAGIIAASGGKNPFAIMTAGTFNNIVRNTGAITGDILLADGADRIENAGTITGNVSLGAGDDVFVQRGGTVTGIVDGGIGSNLLQVDATGGGAVSGAGFVNFARVQQVGAGSVGYSGAFGVPTIELAGGTLTVAAGQQLSTTGATTVTGTGAGVSISNAGVITGGLTLGDGGNSVTNTGAIGGPVLFGAGDDSFRMTSGATLGGLVDGGAGYNSLTLALAADTTLRPGVFQSFQSLATEGASTLVLAGGAFSYAQVSAQGNLAVASDATLAGPVTFGAGDNRLSIAGGFAGAVDGGAGTDTIEVSGGSQAAPVAFSAISNVESYRQTAGFATVAGTGNVGAMYLGGGRFVGLAGSTLTASQVSVDTAATFGSAGIVNGNVVVAGTLSPGASPGTMTVNGNVSLLGGSVSVFELTPAVSDKLVVNGTVGIAPGATLQLAPTGFAGGGALNLVTASGGVSGAFSNLATPASLNGFLSYQATRIQFVTSFIGDASFTPQAGRALAYANGVLASGQASAALLAGLPRLLTASGAANATSFNRITPEAYATAQQIGVESGLAMADSARGAGFAAPADRAGAFTFGELQGDWTHLPRNGASGASPLEASAQGLLGGLGYAAGRFSLGAFAGYRWTDQRVAALGARTRHDGTVAGAQARVTTGGFALTATGAYDGGDAVTSRSVPDGTVRARYGLHGWTGDVAASYALPLGANWRLLPHLGGTVIRDVRDRVNETGGSGFALTVARSLERASFVDGGVGLAGGAAPGARVHPFASVGARWQLDGRDPLAAAGFGGGGITLLADGASSAKVVGTGTLGFGADVASGLSLFGSATGEAAAGEHRIAARAGLRARF